MDGENCPMWNHRSLAPPEPLPKKGKSFSVDSKKRERIMHDREKSRSQFFLLFDIFRKKHGFQFLMRKFRNSIDQMWPPKLTKLEKN